MTKDKFKWLIDRVTDEYGVNSYKDNITEEMTPEDIDDDLWFTCPGDCQEPILYEDYGEELDICIDGFGDRYFICPICDCPIFLDNVDDHFVVGLECEMYEEEDE